MLCADAKKQAVIQSGYPITPVPFTAVHVNSGFWGQRLDASRDVTIPLAFSKCEESGRYENFKKAAHPKPETADGNAARRGNFQNRYRRLLYG